MRVLALAENWQNYSKPMKNFITGYMQLLYRSDAEKMGQLEQRFAGACQVLRNELGEKPFHLRQRLNLAAMDSVMACSVELTDSLKTDLGSEYKSLLADETFMKAVTHNTSDYAVVQKRFELVHSAYSY